jgi:hypothetical protein
MPDPIQPEQPRREFKNCSGNFLNIWLTAQTPSDFHLFGPLKTHLGGKRFANDEEDETEVAERNQKTYAAGFDALVNRWAKCINVGGGYVEK